MTLDKAILHAEEVAEEHEKAAKEWHENQVRKCELIPFAEMDYTHENECKECASEHRQIAEWLKELKKLREGRKRGKWIKKTKTIELNGAIVYDSVWICPKCGTEYDGCVASNLVKYCYCCGAFMGGEQDADSN